MFWLNGNLLYDKLLMWTACVLLYQPAFSTFYSMAIDSGEWDDLNDPWLTAYFLFYTIIDKKLEL